MSRSTEIISEPRRIHMAENKSDLDRELSDIKKEVIEGRNLVIKTDNLLKNLHAELKAVSKKQEEFEKRKLVSSAAAYALFAVMAIVGAVLVSNARVSAAGADKERYEKTIAELTAKVDEAKKADAARLTAEARAFEVYRQMTQLPGDERLKGVEAFAKMSTDGLSPLERSALKDRAEGLRSEIGQSTFERGKQAFRRNEMGEVIKELSRFMAMNPNREDGADASFFLGVAYNQLRQHEKAVPLLASFVEIDKRSKTRDYAMLLLAQSYEMTGSLDKAADVAREAIGTYPNSQFLPQLRGRLATAKRAMNAGAVNTAPAAVPAAAPAAPAAQPAAAPAQ